MSRHGKAENVAPKYWACPPNQMLGRTKRKGQPAPDYRAELPTLPEPMPSPELTPGPVAVAVHPAEYEAGLDIE
jgi:hypothetical protein